MILEQIARGIGRIGRRFIQWWWTPLRLAGIALLLLAILVGTLGYLNEHGGLYLTETAKQILKYLSANISTELASIAITILVVDALHQHRETEREKERLILQMGSPDNAFAREAVRALRARGWLEDGSVRGAYLLLANLQEADLRDANLQEAILQGANLQEAILLLANLQGTDLLSANLQGAVLLKADLRGAILAYADLRDACLGDANLQGANLENANLEGAILRGADLRGADMRGAEYNNVTTSWPEGFTPPPEAINVDAEANVEDR